jgi:hypothetical protein
VRGLLVGAPQTGQGLKGYLNFWLNSGKKIAETFTGQNIPCTFQDGKLVLDKNVIALSGKGWNSFIKGLNRGVGFTGVSIIPQSGREVICPNV